MIKNQSVSLGIARPIPSHRPLMANMATPIGWKTAAGNRRPGRYGKPPPGTTTRCEELAGTDPNASPVRESAAPEPKTATVERREASVLRRTQGASPAPGLPRYVQAQRVPRKHPNDSRRSATPSVG